LIARKTQLKSRKIRPAFLALAAVAIVAGCGLAPSQPTAELPTLAGYNGSCRDISVNGHATGDPALGVRRDIVWPPGYTARFTPELEIVDEKGVIAFRDGDSVRGGWVTGPDAQGPLLIAAGFGAR
jgi:hypothetical protein